MSASKPLLQDLFAAAREDAPSDVVRDQVWDRVTAATSLGAGAAAGAKTGTAPVAKLVVISTLVGAGAASSVFAITSADAPPPPARRAPACAASGQGGARLAEPLPRGRAASTHAPIPHAPPTAAATTDADSSGLAEEARLVTAARLALVRGEPERALALARSTQRLPARALEPEELGLEARALRALGRTDEALATELKLRNGFPTHALSR